MTLQTFSYLLIIVIAVWIILIYLEIGSTHDIVEKYINHHDKKKLEEYKDIWIFVKKHDEMYNFNLESYEEFISKLKRFVELYERSSNPNENFSELFEISEQLKNNILNTYHSFIYQIPNSEPLSTSVPELNDILVKYLDKIYYECQNNNFVNGFDVTYKMPMLQPKPSNYYNKLNYTFDIY